MSSILKNWKELIETQSTDDPTMTVLCCSSVRHESPNHKTSSKQHTSTSIITSKYCLTPVLMLSLGNSWLIVSFPNLVFVGHTLNGKVEEWMSSKQCVSAPYRASEDCYRWVVLSWGTKERSTLHDGMFGCPSNISKASGSSLQQTIECAYTPWVVERKSRRPPPPPLK